MYRISTLLLLPFSRKIKIKCRKMWMSPTRLTRGGQCPQQHVRQGQLFYFKMSHTRVYVVDHTNSEHIDKIPVRSFQSSDVYAYISFLKYVALS